MAPRPPGSTPFPYTTLFRSEPMVEPLDEPRHQIALVMLLLLRIGRSGRLQVLEHDRYRIRRRIRSEEHTSELQSLAYLVCRLLLEKKKRRQTQLPVLFVNEA